MSNFSNCSLKQLLNLINKDFYDYISTKEDFINYATNIYQKACLSMGQNMPIGKVCIAKLAERVYGSFNQLNNVMYFDEKPFECFDLCKLQKNTFLPYRVAQTALHEARHYAQHNNGEAVDEYLRKFAVFSKVYKEFTTQKYIDYNTNPLEVDARHYAYSVLYQFPYLRQFISHQRYIDCERKCSKGYSSIYIAYLRANSAMHQLKEIKNETVIKVLEDLGKSCVSFLQTHNIDPKEFGNALLQFSIRAYNTRNLRYNEKETNLLNNESQKFDIEFAEKIFNDKIVTSEELLKCHDKMYSLKARPQMIERAYYQINLNTYKATETRKMYVEYAPMFKNLINLNTQNIQPPKDEIDFIQQIQKND